MATHSSVLAWKIPGVGEPGGLPSVGSHRVRHDWNDLAAAAATNKNNNKEDTRGSSLVVRWLGLWPFTAGDMGWILGWGTKILQALWCRQKKKKDIRTQPTFPLRGVGFLIIVKWKSESILHSLRTIADVSLKDTNTFEITIYWRGLLCVYNSLDGSVSLIKALVNKNFSATKSNQFCSWVLGKKQLWKVEGREYFKVFRANHGL